MQFGRLGSILALSFMLVVLPALSWYYLSKGVTYRRDRLSQLKHYGEVPAFNFRTIRGTTVSQDSLHGNITLISVLDVSSPTSAAIADAELLRFQKAFGPERDDIRILSIPVGNATDSVAVSTFAKAHKTGRVWTLVQGDSSSTFRRFVSRLGIEQYTGVTDVVGTPYFLLIDTSGQIRHYYPAVHDSINRMIELTALMMRPTPKSEIRYKRNNGTPTPATK